MIVLAARPCSCWHWLTAVAPNPVPGFWQLSGSFTAAGILVSRMSNCDGGGGSADGSGEEAGLELVLAGGLEDWDADGGATVLAGNGLRCATAATPR